MAEQLRAPFKKFVDLPYHSVYIFEKWVERCKKRISCQGKYFEKGPSPHFYKVPTRSNKVSPWTFQTVLVAVRPYFEILCRHSPGGAEENREHLKTACYCPFSFSSGCMPNASDGCYQCANLLCAFGSWYSSHASIDRKEDGQSGKKNINVIFKVTSAY
jgi:hypothetical protein